MGIYDREDDLQAVPPRIKVAMKFLQHTRWVTHQEDVSVPARSLTKLETSVETAALKTLQAYLLGEMDFADGPPKTSEPRKDDEDPGVRELQPR